MKRILSLCALCALVLSAPPLTPRARAASAAPPDANFILIGWDGAQRSRVKKMLAAGKLPNLENLIKEGGIVETRVVTGQTSTKAGWAEILTGYTSSRLKVLSNDDYRPIPEGYTVFERLKARFGGAIATIFITGKRYNLGARGPHQICVNAENRDPVTRAQTYYPDRERFNGTTRDGKPPVWTTMDGEPYFNAVKALDYYSATDDAAADIGKKAAEALEKHGGKPFFALIHFKEPDEPGHLYGESSPEYEEALVSVDRQLGGIVRELKRLGLYSKTVVFVTADHGFNEGTMKHRNAPLMTLAYNRAGKLRNGDRKDITPAILDWYGFAPAEIKPPLDGRTLFVSGAAPGAGTPVRLGYFIGGRTILFGRAFADGAFDREGVKVELTTRWLRGALVKVPENLEKVKALEKEGGFGKMTGTEIIDLMDKGVLDGGLVGEGSFLKAVHGGSQLAAVALLGHDAKDSPGHGIVLRKGVVIKKPEDFAGLTLLSRRAGPSDALFLREFLRREGVPEKSVTIIDQVDDDQIPPMLKEGRADGGYLHLMALSRLVEDKSVYLYRPMNWVNPELSLALLVFRRDFLKEHGDLAVKIVAGYAKRIAHERTIPPEQRQKSRKGKHGKTGVMEMDFRDMSIPVYDHPPKVRLELLDEMQSLMVAHGLLKGATDLGGFVDAGVVEAACPDPASPAR